MKINSLISPKICQKLFKGIEITDTQRKAQQKWLDLLETDKLGKEVKNYPVFMNTILRDLLGFPEELIEKAYEQKDVEFAFKDPQGQWSVLFEAKGTETKELDALQHRAKANQATPLKQTYDNLLRFEFIKYGVCTNYQKFILMDYNLKFSALQEFDFLSTKNNDEKLKEFIGIFSYQTLVINKDILKFKSESENADKELTTEFYKLFHETRMMLITAFKDKQDVSEGEALFYAQLFLERILFLFFALDNGLIDNSKLFTERILNQLKLKQCTEDSRKIYDDINLLFKALDQGSKVLGIDGFNGELFSGSGIPSKIHFLDFQTKSFFAECIMNSKLSQELKLHGDSAEVWKQFGKDVSPIIKNLLIMDSRDFNSELNVTILGHILEQSLDDINEFQKTGEMKRKIEGVYYTPHTLTNYICQNTIISYLSKSNVNDVHELVSEYEDNIEELQEKLEKIKIIDPACGSGAFLINAAQILLEITEAINLTKDEKTPTSKSGTLDVWQKEAEVSKIIKNNIFGVDINRDSVAITKLSLFLIMAKPGEKLTNLSQNILNGNSLIHDKSVDELAFDWKAKFPKIMEDGGFDIVVGNPPWQIVKSDVDEFFSPLHEMKFLLASDPKTRNTPFSKLTKNKKNLFVHKCLENKKIASDYQNYLDNYKKLMNYFLSAQNYDHQISTVNGKKVRGIDLNLYKLFLEKSFLVLKKNGMFGMVLPNGLSSDLGTKSLRQLLFNSCEILELCGFINKKPIFQDVHRQFKFCTLLYKKSSSKSSFLAKFRQIDDTQLSSFRTTAMTYDRNLIAKMAPESLLITESDSATQYIFEKLFKFPLLCNSDPVFAASRELHMTDDSKFFHTSDVGIRLFEGKMIYQFSDSLLSPTYWCVSDEIRKELTRRENYRQRKTSKNLTNFTPRIHVDDYRLVWRTITNSIDRRTLIATVLPPNVVLGNSLNYLWSSHFNTKHNDYVKLHSYEETLFLCGLFNSFVIDFVLRHRIGTNLNLFFVLELPIPKFDKNDILHKKIVINSAKLICTTAEFSNLRKQVDISDFVTDSDKRITLQAQINAYTAKIYGLNQSNLETILEIFTIEDPKLKELTMDEFSLL